MHQDQQGMQIYLAVRGGLPYNAVCRGLKSTFVSGEVGGHQGWRLVSGDFLQIAGAQTLSDDRSKTVDIQNG